MQKWDHWIVSIGGHTTDAQVAAAQRAATRAGEDGWELVSMVQAPGTYEGTTKYFAVTLAFKRPRAG